MTSISMATSLSAFSFLFPTHQPPKTSLRPLHLSFPSPQPHCLPLSQSHLDDPDFAPVGARVYNVKVALEENEPGDRMLDRFRREVMKAGIIQECKRRRFYETKQEEKKRKSREAARRNRRRRFQPRVASQSRQEDNPIEPKNEVEDNDNWELPGGNIPY